MPVRICMQLNLNNRNNIPVSYRQSNQASNVSVKLNGNNRMRMQIPQGGKSGCSSCGRG